MILSPNCTLPIASYFDPIVVDDNERIFILVLLVSVPGFITKMDICLVVFFPDVVANDGIGIFSR